MILGVIHLTEKDTYYTKKQSEICSSQNLHIHLQVHLGNKRFCLFYVNTYCHQFTVNTYNVFVLYILHFWYLFHVVLSLKLNFLCINCIIYTCVCVYYVCINKISQTVYKPRRWRISFFQTILNNSSVRQVFAYLGFTVGLISTCLNLPMRFHGSN